MTVYERSYIKKSGVFVSLLNVFIQHVMFKNTGQGALTSP